MVHTWSGRVDRATERKWKESQTDQLAWRQVWIQQDAQTVLSILCLSSLGDLRALLLSHLEDFACLFVCFKNPYSTLKTKHKVRT